MGNKLFMTACLAAFVVSGAYAADTTKTDGKTSDTAKTSTSSAAPTTKATTASAKPATTSAAVKAPTTPAKTTTAAVDTKTKSKDSSAKN